ncbi:unnamed protein product [Pleuronectes platessa]|uniref:Transmembrane protein TMEM132 cohesin-like domain-containing protein n=1 Tax=Pleuronectes platessa TaxID=8262 RepID=A0A9N7V8F6_PLEPL|nr:unnamed protein product [Pleuronectes platessa]
MEVMEGQSGELGGHEGGVRLKDGVAFLGARASNPVAWTVSQDVRSEGHRVVTLHCRRKENSFGQRTLGHILLQEKLSVRHSERTLQCSQPFEDLIGDLFDLTF